MSQQTLKPADVQPLGPGEFKPAAPDEAPSPGPGEESSAARAQAIVNTFNRIGVHASGPQVQEALTRQGVRADLPEIANVRNHLLHRGTAAEGAAGEPSQPAAGMTDAETRDLLKVKEWAREVGGPQRLKELCDLLLRLPA